MYGCLFGNARRCGTEDGGRDELTTNCRVVLLVSICLSGYTFVAVVLFRSHTAV